MWAQVRNLNPNENPIQEHNSDSGRLDCTKSLNHPQIHTMSHCIFVVTSHFLWCLHRVGTTSLQSSKKFSAPTSPSTGFALRSSDVDPFTGPLEQNAGIHGIQHEFQTKRPRRIGGSVRFLVDLCWISVGYMVRWGTPNQLLTRPAGPKPRVSQ